MCFMQSSKNTFKLSKWLKGEFDVISAVCLLGNLEMIFSSHTHTAERVSHATIIRLLVCVCTEVIVMTLLIIIAY